MVTATVTRPNWGQFNCVLKKVLRCYDVTYGAVYRSKIKVPVRPVGCGAPLDSWLWKSKILNFPGKFPAWKTIEVFEEVEVVLSNDERHSDDSYPDFQFAGSLSEADRSNTVTVASADGFDSGMRLNGLLQLLHILQMDVLDADTEILDLSSSSTLRSSSMLRGVESSSSYMERSSQLHAGEFTVSNLLSGELAPKLTSQKIIVSGNLSTHQLSRKLASQPTSRPSDQPTSHPSGKSSDKPSGRPSTRPSDQPTSQPTELPTHQPISAPTSQPSAQPTRHLFVVAKSDLHLMQRSFVFSILVSVLCCTLCVSAILFWIEKYDAQAEKLRVLRRSAKVKCVDLESAFTRTVCL